MRTQQIDFAEDDISILTVIDPAISEDECSKVMMQIKPEDFPKYEADPSKIDYVAVVNASLLISSKSKCGTLIAIMAKETPEMKEVRKRDKVERMGNIYYKPTDHSSSNR